MTQLLMDIPAIGQAKPAMTYDEACQQIRAAMQRHVRFGSSANWTLKLKEHYEWKEALRLGRNYMVGESVPMDAFIATHGSRLNAWQKVAYQWAKDNPTLQLHIETEKMHWCVYGRDGYVEFYLPHQDHGGENAYISCDGRVKIHVDED